MKVMAQLAFNGSCRQAFELYEAVLNGKITVMNTFGGNEDRELPPGSSAGAPEHVRFAELQIGDYSILGNDVPEGHFKEMQGFNIALHTRSVSEARRVFDSLAEGGRVSTPLTEVSWARRFGMVTDRCGVPWLVLAVHDEQD